MPTGLVIKVNNFAFALTFKVVNADGTPRDLTGLSVTFYVYTQEETPTILFSGPCVILSPSTTGVCTYTVLNGNFNTVGTFDAELELTIPAPPGPFSYLEETETFNINVIPGHP
jgi:baseplate upper protein BppU